MNWTRVLDQNQRERSLAIVEAIATDLRTHFSVPGRAGVAWSLAHVDGWLFDLSDGDPIEAVDKALLDFVTTSAWDRDRDYDLLAGLAGIGVYALERLPRPVARELLAAVVLRLTELAEGDPRHPFWWTPGERLPAQVRPRFPTGAWNLGSAHGASGVVGLLGLACAAGVTGARPLLDHTMGAEWRGRRVVLPWFGRAGARARGWVVSSQTRVTGASRRTRRVDGRGGHRPGTAGCRHTAVPRWDRLYPLS